MRPVEWLRPPRLVLTLFIALMVLCALALGWLARQVFVQDRAVEAQRRQEQLENAADRAAAAMERTLVNDHVDVTVTLGGELSTTPTSRLAYVPTEPASAPALPDAIAKAEAFEYSAHDLGRAAETYMRLAENGPPRLRAEALVRLARVLRRQKRWSDALQTYGSLQKLGDVPVAGIPAGLIAAAGRCAVLGEMADYEAARRESAALFAHLTEGRWNLTKAVLETYLDELKALSPDLPLPADWNERMALAEAAHWAFAQPASTGIEGLLMDGQPVSISWERHGGAWKARLTGPSSWRALWTRLERESGAALEVTDSAGQVVHGKPLAGTLSVIRTAALTGLPWSLTTTMPGGAARSEPWTTRRRLLIAGILVFALLVCSGSWLIVRALNREFAVAQLQSDFVAAVSHEFRTPLTSIRQLTEMLARGRMPNEQHKQRAYELMLGESDRLRRLVDALLDLRRMQARQYEFRSEKLEAAEWSRAVAEEFQGTVRESGYLVEFRAPDEPLPIRGDREALGGALWNLLDNAVKYSPAAKQVEVSVSSRNGRVEVQVRDYGSGIAKEDLKHVFARFYRGANARRDGAGGTGIGLATVKEIVEAHGGTVLVRSEVGSGSEFTMVLPCDES
ncbi:MAG TPA: ATP-binding protein [Candidatus Limnocylindrales bacterium]|nr:ATP-binding protein [Candidatus Limnocylindrales bacterium]